MTQQPVRHPFGEGAQHGGARADRHNFRPGTTFGDMLDWYVFDRKLRLLAISVRAAKTNQIAPRHGADWYHSRRDGNRPG
jgi:hypothetical protein